MFTLREALELPIFQEARVVAGGAGLERDIRWVHIIHVPDAAQWLHGGELALTTWFNLPRQPDEQCDLLRQLAAKGIVSVVITVGNLVEQIPDYLRAVGDELSLPLIELPYETRFVDIAKAINERIAQENLDKFSRALMIQQRLTQLVLEGGGFTELAEMLAELVSHSISIENERFEAIASKNIAAVDLARRYTIEQGRTDPALIAALEAEHLPRIRESLRPAQLPVMPHVGLEMERLLAPIVVHGEIYGYMWIIADLQALSPIDMMALEIGATVAALLMLHQESLQTAEASLKGSLIARLIDGDDSRQTSLNDQALRYGIDLRERWQMLLIDIRDADAAAVAGAYRRVNQALAASDQPAVAARFGGQVVIITDAGADLDALARTLLSRLSGDRRISISQARSGVESVGLAHQQCVETLDIHRRLASPGAIWHFADLGYLHTLYQAGRGGLDSNPLAPALRRLMAEKQADLFATLEAYLDAGGNGAQTAERLHIHRSTLNYRLSRIREICGIELSSPEARVNLQVALKLLRLFEAPAT